MVVCVVFDREKYKQVWHVGVRGGAAVKRKNRNSESGGGC